MAQKSGMAVYLERVHYQSQHRKIFGVGQGRCKGMAKNNNRKGGRHQWVCSPKPKRKSSESSSIPVRTRSLMERLAFL